MRALLKLAGIEITNEGLNYHVNLVLGRLLITTAVATVLVYGWHVLHR